MRPKDYCNRMEKARRDLRNAISGLLKTSGWEYTCELSEWLWKKEMIDGRFLYVSQETALDLAMRDL